MRLALYATPLLAVVLCAPPGWSMSQEPRSLGLGGVRQSLEDLPLNAVEAPALLGLPASASAMTYMIPLPLLSLGVSNDAFGFNELDSLLSGKAFTASEAQGILDSIPAQGIGLMADAGLALAFTSADWHMGWFLRSSVDTIGLNVPKDLMGLLIKGNAVQTEVSLGSLAGARVDAYADTGLGWALPLPALRGALGISGRVIKAFGFARVSQAQGDLVKFAPDGTLSGHATASIQYATGFDTLSAQDILKSLATPRGLGGAIDLSVVSEVAPSIRLVAGLANLGAVHWDRITEKVYTYDLPPTRLGFNQGTSFNTNLVPVTAESPGSLDGHELWDILPPMLSVGANWSLYEKLPLHYMAEFEMGFGRGYGVSTVPEFHTGMEALFFGMVPLRVGLGAGGEKPTLYSLGTGVVLPDFQIDVAMGALGGFGSGAMGAYYALGLRRLIH